MSQAAAQAITDEPYVKTQFLDRTQYRKDLESVDNRISALATTITTTQSQVQVAVDQVLELRKRINDSDKRVMHVEGLVGLVLQQIESVRAESLNYWQQVGQSLASLDSQGKQTQYAMVSMAMAIFIAVGTFLLTR